MPPDAPAAGIVGELERAIESMQTSATWTAVFEGLSELDDAARRCIAGHCQERATSIVKSLRDVVMDGDETEAVMMLPGIFLELRFEWSRYNSQIQYQSILQGAADPALMARGSVVSMLLEVIESALSAEHAFWVNRIAADPINSVASRGDTVKRLLGLALSARASQRRALECLDELGKSVGAGDANNGMTIAVERAKDETVASSDSVIVMRTTEIHDILELLVVEKLAGRRMRVLVHQGDVDTGTTVLPEVVLALREVLAQWLDQIFTESLETSGAERERLGKSAHLNLRWSLRLVHTRLYFHLEDDGCGTAPTDPSALPDVKVWTHLRLRVGSEQTPEVGGKLTVTCEASSFSSFLICSVRVDDPGGDLRIAIVTTTVVSVLSAANRMPTDLGLIRAPDGALIPIIDLCDLWPGLDLAPPHENSVFIVLATERSGRVALRVDDIPGAMRAAILTQANSNAAPEVVGFVSLKDGLALVIDTDRLAAHLAPGAELKFGT